MPRVSGLRLVFPVSRLGSDNSASKEGGYIDNMVVQNCLSDLIFEDGFQTP